MEKDPLPQKADTVHYERLTQALIEASREKPKHPRWTRFWKIFGGIALLVSFLGTSYGLWQSAQVRQSNVAALDIYVAGAETAVAQYAVPIDAPFSELPINLEADPNVPSAQTCSKEQHEWFGRYGRRFSQDLIIQMRNTANTGTLTVRDFKAEGRLETARVPLIPFYCVLPIGTAISQQLGILPVDNRSTAVWKEHITHSDLDNGAYPAGSPVVYDLAAGESAMLLLLTERKQDFYGVITSKVYSSDRESSVTLRIHDSDKSGDEGTLFIPNFTLDPDFSVRIGGSSPEQLAKPFEWGHKTLSTSDFVRGTLNDLVEHLDALRSQHEGTPRY